MTPSKRRMRQRVAIIIIMIAMVVGTIGSFVVIILQNENDQLDAQRQQEAYAEYQASSEEYQRKKETQTAELSDRYYDIFSAYADRPAEFNADDVDSLDTQNLRTGDGATIDENTPFAAYYIGWNPDGTVFDQSIEDEALKAPLEIESLSTAGVIEGWKEGIKGMKIGGVRLLTIPSDKAYGAQGSGEDIPANTPLRFIVMVIEKPETIPEPEIPEILLQGAAQ